MFLSPRRALETASSVNFDEKKRKIEQDGNVELTTNRATKRYLVKGYDVVSIQLGNDITGSPVVFINKDDQASEVAMPTSLRQRR